MPSKRYMPEFRAEAVRQVTERGYPVREIAQRMGVSTYSLYKRLKGANKTPRLAAKEDLRERRRIAFYEAVRRRLTLLRSSGESSKSKMLRSSFICCSEQVPVSGTIPV